MGFEPTNLTLTPDDSIGLGSLNPSKKPYWSPVLDRNWTEIRNWTELFLQNHNEPVGHSASLDLTCFSVQADRKVLPSSPGVLFLLGYPKECSRRGILAPGGGVTYVLAPSDRFRTAASAMTGCSVRVARSCSSHQEVPKVRSSCGLGDGGRLSAKPVRMTEFCGEFCGVILDSLTFAPHPQIIVRTTRRRSWCRAGRRWTGARCGCR
jgi:hypothetical protein